jgi:AraC-like DNA-binding protein
MHREREENQGPARQAHSFQPESSPAVFNIVNYRFGSQPEATRPDTILRSPMAAVLVQRSGRLYQHDNQDRPIALPDVALLGASATAHVWSTEPNTAFSLINLAPGAVRRIFGLDPRDIGEEVESLQDHALADRIRENLDKGRLVLHDFLCALFHGNDDGASDDDRARLASRVLQKRSLGDRVRDYADQFGVTQRTLQRTIRAAIGLTPKQILAIERLRDLVTLTAGGWQGTLAELAQDGGFFDQSHLRHEILRYNFSALAELAEGDHIVVQS